jgi:mono/diheme cytochrome c family protein
MPYDTLVSFIRTTTGTMPPYSAKILSDDDLSDIYAYLQSIPKPPDPKSIPLLNP